MQRVLLFTLLAFPLFLLTAFSVKAATINPLADQIKERTEKVTITFSGLPDGNYEVCILSGGPCNPATTSPLYLKKVTAVENTVIINVCGDGQDKLKIVSDKCSKSDYFHEGKRYRAQLWLVDSTRGGWRSRMLDEASFTVTPRAPEYKIEPEKPVPNDRLTVTVKGRRDGGDSRNNYAFRISEQNGKKINEACFVVDSNSDSGQVSLPPQREGTYLLSIREQVDEMFGIRGCKGSDDQPYIERSVIIAVGGGQLLNDETKIDDTFIKKDKEPDAPPPPCAGPLVNGKCTAVKTAIGDISTEPAGFIGDIFKLLLGISGGIALILIISSGYKFMASQGNPEQVQEARETLTSAIVGLLFIIFSFVILQVIGVDILRIPGFGG